MTDSPDSFDYANHPHRRRNPLTDEWVLVSPHRNQRPWAGQTEAQATPVSASYDPDCYLCPGNERMGGSTNPDFETTFAFTNDFPALKDNTPVHKAEDPLFASQSEHGECRVVSYSPDHSKTLAEFSTAELHAVINEWARQSDELGQQYRWVQVFENKGEIMGCSMPHPHGQIWAQSHAPTMLHKEDVQQKLYSEEHQERMLLDYAQREQKDGSRVVVDGTSWLAVVPYWAAWPFEVLLLPLFPVARLGDLQDQQRKNLADTMRALLTRYDNLFECSFPYSMGWHGAPYGGPDQDNRHWQLHAHFYPPLLRSKSVRKFMVGYEMLAEPQRDLTPEQAALILRALPNTHYRET